MTKDIVDRRGQQGAAFWEGLTVNTKFHPYSIAFFVDDHCPIYMDDFMDWTEYYIESWPSNTISYFILEGYANTNTVRAAIDFKKLIGATLDTFVNNYEWTMHGGFTTA